MNLTIKRFFDFYLNASIHVSFAVLALVQMTFYLSDLPCDIAVSTVAFSGTLFSYNFIKYADLIYKKRGKISAQIKAIAALSAWALTVGVISFFYLEQLTQWVTLGFLALAVLYAIPIYPKVPNLRNWAGLKIYIVSWCWAGVTVILPVINAGRQLTWDSAIKCVQRFILVLILILIFEIVDLKCDDEKLRTVPQTLGIEKTKQLILALLIPFFGIEFFKIGFQPLQAWNNLVILLLVVFFIWKATPQQSKYFTLFWVESVPIVWWLLVVGENIFS